MGTRREKVLSLLLVIMNLIVVIKLLRDSFKIQEFGFGFTAFLLIVGVLIYLLTSVVLKGN